MTNLTKKLPHDCPTCGGMVAGRSDKIYCSLKCKNKHHARARKRNIPFTENKNRRLLRNLTVLQGIVGENIRFAKIHKDELKHRGFDLSSCTGCLLKKGRILYECYHFSYYITVDGVVHIEQHLQVTYSMPGFFERWEVDYPKGLYVGRRSNGKLKSPNKKRRKK